MVSCYTHPKLSFMNKKIKSGFTLHYLKNIQNMFHFDDVTGENTISPSPNYSYIPDYPCKILIADSSGSGNTSALFNLIHHQPGNDKICLYTTDPNV